MQDLVKKLKAAGMSVSADGEGFKVEGTLMQAEAFGRACIASAFSDNVTPHNPERMLSMGGSCGGCVRAGRD